MNSFRQMMNVAVPMPDGVALSCDIRMPHDGDRFPAVLVRNPYNKAVAVTDPELRAYLAAGFAHVVQDVRGKHESPGVYDPFAQEAADGEATVRWVAAQPWCDGTVVMTGASYCGWTQLAAAGRAPEALRAIAPSVMGTDPYRHNAFPGGAPSMIMLWWAILNNGRSQREEVAENWDDVFRTLPLRRMDSAVGCPSPAMQMWLDHPTRDAMWVDSSVEPHYGRMRAATLMVGGWYDPFCVGVINAYQGLVAAGARNARLLVGPWSHNVAAGPILGDLNFGPDSALDVDRIKREFLIAHAADGGASLDGPPARVFVMGVNQWRNFEQFPPAGAETKAFYLGCETYANSLHGDGFLADEPAGAKAVDEYTYDPEHPVPAIGGAALVTNEPGPCDQRPAERRDDVLCYTTAPLAEPLAVVGAVKLELHVSSSAPDTDFVGRLCDVYPDGRSILLCDGILRTRFREGFDKEVMMADGEVYRLEIDLGFTACVFAAGHRLRLEVTSSCFPRFARNLNTGGAIADEDAPVLARQTIHHGPARPSRLLLTTAPGVV